MMQQDTFWRRNLFDLNLEEKSVAEGYDALFDQVGDGNTSQRAEWVNGNFMNIFLKFQASRKKCLRQILLISCERALKMYIHIYTLRFKAQISTFTPITIR